MDTHREINIAIIGASGYTGAELIRLLLPHPYVRIAALTGDSQAGRPIGDVYPHLAHAALPDLVTLEQVDFSVIDLAFCCLPHGTSQTVIASLPAHLNIIDLSADFRLFDPLSYAKWYGQAHQATELQKQAVYGLTELARDEIKTARLIANPGCYPTSALLPLMPLLKTQSIKTDTIIIDAKSGITGAGRSVRQASLFAEVNDGVGAYGIANHRHAPEIEQSLSWAAEKDVMVTFTPHLMPMNRGILSTIYVKLEDGKRLHNLREALEHAYAHEPFVHLLPDGALPTTHQVRGSNHCIMNIFDDRIAGQAIIVSAIDNLVKGASGQAVQNMNLVYGWPETTSLQLSAFFP